MVLSHFILRVQIIALTCGGLRNENGQKGAKDERQKGLCVHCLVSSQSVLAKGCVHLYGEEKRVAACQYNSI